MRTRAHSRTHLILFAATYLLSHAFVCLSRACSYSEFRSMLEATVTLNLKRMLLTEAGLHHVEKHMEQEFSKENLTFWQAVRGYRDAEDRYSAAKVIMDHYVRPGSEEEVNLPSGIRETLVKTFDAWKGELHDAVEARQDREELAQKMAARPRTAIHLFFMCSS